MGYAAVFPGQGSQRKGMGRQVFDAFDSLVQEADAVLGYSVKDLCLKDAEKKLNLTQYTQPALFVVNALSYLAWVEKEGEPQFLAGHSLGEYNALVAAGAMDFSTGLELVKKRGALMAGMQRGGMAAVMGVDGESIQKCLAENGLSAIELANINTPVQTVISGERNLIESAKQVFESEKGGRCVTLPVSGAFHSSFMAEAAEGFRAELSRVRFSPLQIPVISNVLASPFPESGIGELLSRQMISPVLWMDSVRYIRARGIEEIIETGPGRVLTRMLKAIDNAESHRQ